MITKTCAISGQDFTITDDDMKFYERMEVDPPTLCPLERERRRLSWRNERCLYRRKCSASGKVIISMHDQDAPFPVYDPSYWWSDNWDPLDYGRDFDFSRPFFEQFHELNQVIPKMGMVGTNLENADFCNLIADCKNCYLVFESSNNEDCLYGYWLQKCRDCIECAFVHECELCYECQDCYNCYDCQFTRNSRNCSSSIFLEDCTNCKNCFGCVNLRNKEYHFLNQPLSKEEYKAKLQSLNLHQRSALDEMQKSFTDFSKKFPKKYAHIEQCENCSGDYIINAKNCHNAYHVYDAEEGKYVEHFWRDAKYAMDVSTFGRGAELGYECINCGVDAYNIRFGSQCWGGGADLTYCHQCFGTKESFGCTNLKKHKHCILNKAYTKDEYEKLNKKIIQHMKDTEEWGEFFPTAISPIAYNESVAQIDFPLTREEALDRGFQWKEEQNGSKYIGEPYMMPDSIHDVEDEVLEQILTCPHSGKHFKIQKTELGFHKKLGIPLPQLHPDIRHIERMNLRNPRKLWTRKCDASGVEIQTTYAPDRLEKVLCEEEYLKVVN